MKMRHSASLVFLGCVVGILAATILSPNAANGGEVPPELRAQPAKATTAAKGISLPLIEATRKVRPAVVKIVSFGKDWRGRLLQTASGSGFIVSKEGHILTNRHVVQGTAVVQLEDGRQFEKIEVLGADRRSDVAVLQIRDGDRGDLPVAVLGDSDALEVGEMVIAIGSPFELASSVSAGVVSATGRVGVHRGQGSSEEFIQTDAALNPGNSGGPLINLDGHVVGINTAIQGVTGANVGIGFSIPINLARTVATALIETGEARRGWLGVYGRQLTSSALEREGISAPGGFRVQRVEQDSPAAKAGIRAGATLVEVDGRPLRDLNVLHARLAQAGPGGRVRITYVLDETERRTVEVDVTEQPVYTFGIEVADLDPARARSFGLPEGTQGVVVTRIAEGSAADTGDDANRLLPGDVIVSVATPIGRFRITSRENFEDVMRELGERPPQVVQFLVVTKQGYFRVTIEPTAERS